MMRRIATVWVFILWSVGACAADLPDFTGLVEASKPSVVNISTSREVDRSQHPGFRLPDGMQEGPWGDLFRRFFEQPPRGGGEPWSQQENHSLGSGFIISEDGYIVTNHHVIDGADEVIVRLHDRRELKAEVIGSDQFSDTALLKIDAGDLRPLKLGDSSRLKAGEWVLAIGSPFGFDHSVTSGIVSAKGRSLSNQNYVPFIQTDVAVNPGNSGGPLINMDGEVVGVNSQIFSNTGGFMGLSFAVPIELALEVVDQLKEQGHVSRGWLGVMIQEVTRELAESFDMDKPQGALVSQVMPDSPAAEAGIRPGDVILQFNGREVPSSSALPPMVGRIQPGDTAKLEVLRDGRVRTLKVEIGELSDDKMASAGQQPPAQAGKSGRLGLALKDTDEKIRNAYNIDGGVLVTDVGPGPAAEAGIRPGDVIVSLNNQPVEGVADFTKKLDQLKPGSSVAVLVQRKRGPIYLALRIPKDDG